MKKKITKSQKALLLRIQEHGGTSRTVRADPADLRNLYLHGKIHVSNPKDEPARWLVWSSP